MTKGEHTIASSKSGGASSHVTDFGIDMDEFLNKRSELFDYYR